MKKKVLMFILLGLLLVNATSSFAQDSVQLCWVVVSSENAQLYERSPQGSFFPTGYYAFSGLSVRISGEIEWQEGEIYVEAYGYWLQEENLWVPTSCFNNQSRTVSRAHEFSHEAAESWCFYDPHTFTLVLMREIVLDDYEAAVSTTPISLNLVEGAYLAEDRATGRCYLVEMNEEVHFVYRLGLISDESYGVGVRVPLDNIISVSD